MAQILRRSAILLQRRCDGLASIRLAAVCGGEGSLQRTQTYAQAGLVHKLHTQVPARSFPHTGQPQSLYGMAARGLSTGSDEDKKEQAVEQELAQMTTHEYEVLNEYKNEEYEEEQRAEMEALEAVHADLMASYGTNAKDDVEEGMASRRFPSYQEILAELSSDEEELIEKKETERKKRELQRVQRVRQVDANGRCTGLGRRKTAVARVFLTPVSDGVTPTFTVNNRLFHEYFANLEQRMEIVKPFVATQTLGKFDVEVQTNGGGITGQAGAVVLGLARALQNWDPELRPAMKKEGLMTRDMRRVERKKPGLAKARKAYQWVKR